MKHLFASGECIYLKNVKDLEQGKLVVEYLNYDDVTEDTIFEAVGVIDDKPAVVKFKIKNDGFEDIKFRYSVKILMQSDLIQADWESYEVAYT